MQLKKRISAIAKSITPFIEASNSASELNDLAMRMEQLVGYQEEKEARAKRAAKVGSMGQNIADNKQAEEAERAAKQAEEAAKDDERLEKLREESYDAFRKEGQRSQNEAKYGDPRGDADAVAAAEAEGDKQAPAEA